MQDKKNMKMKIWIYAVVLFTSAFIVLLITAYTQIKLNRNIVDYKNQITSQQKEKNKFKTNLANAQQLNNKLIEENEKLELQKKELEEIQKTKEEEFRKAEDISKSKLEQYENLCLAQVEYLSGNVVQSAQLLKNIDTASLDENALKAYQELLKTASLEAGKKLYEEGYKLYLKKDYNNAITKFILSKDISKGQEYSDNCLYYFAKALYGSGNKQAAIAQMKELIEKYPSSSFVKSATRFIERHK